MYFWIDYGTEVCHAYTKCRFMIYYSGMVFIILWFSNNDWLNLSCIFLMVLSRRRHMSVLASQITGNSSLCQQLIQANKTEIIKAMHYWTLNEWSPSVTGGLPSHKVSNSLPCQDSITELYYPWYQCVVYSLVACPVDPVVVHSQTGWIQGTYGLTFTGVGSSACVRTTMVQRIRLFRVSFHALCR